MECLVIRWEDKWLYIIHPESVSDSIICLAAVVAPWLQTSTSLVLVFGLSWPVLPWKMRFFWGFDFEDVICANFRGHICNQRVKISRYTKFQSDRKYLTIGNLSQSFGFVVFFGFFLSRIYLRTKSFIWNIFLRYLFSYRGNVKNVKN